MRLLKIANNKLITKQKSWLLLANFIYIFFPVYSSSAYAAFDFSSSVFYPAGVNVGAVTTGDFNGDGIKDLAVSNATTTTVNVMLGRGDGTFSQNIDYPTGFRPIGITVGDVNSDGNIDILTANSPGPDVIGFISVLLGKGDGTFEPFLKFDACNRAGCDNRSILLVDINRDNKLDVVATSYTYQTIGILLGDGNGNFQLSASHGNSTGTGVLAADFNIDGIIDLATSRFFYDDIGVFMGKNDGTFEPAISLPVGDGPLDVKSGDFNLDGRVDLVAANSISNSLSVYLGNGDGTFQPKFDLAVDGYRPESVTVNDFNLDGKLDISVTCGSFSTGYNEVIVFLGNGDGLFNSNYKFSIPTSHVLNHASSDFNADGKPDIVTANADGNSVAILLNATTDTTPPEITPLINGTIGNNSWYTSDVSINWSVADPETMILSKSGCGLGSIVNDTLGVTLECTATSYGGSNTATTIIKRDTALPSVIINAPTDNITYKRNQKIDANYSCNDVTAGIRSCIGTVANGMRINTKNKIQNAVFTVNAIDNAGNISTKTVTYSVK